MNSRLGVSPVVGVALLLVIAVISVVGFQTWFNTFSSSTLSGVESQGSGDVIASGVKTVVADQLYFNNGYNDNLTVSKVTVGGNNCNFSGLLSSGLSNLSLSNNCTQNLSSSVSDVVVYTDKGIFTSKMRIGSVSLAGSSDGGGSLCNGGTQDFNFTGDYQSFTVPEGCTEISVKVWGAGGGASDGTGGGGGYASRNLTVSEGDTLAIVVGEGGNSKVQSGGGAAAGGGLSGVFDNTTIDLSSSSGRNSAHSLALVIAGGGGGGPSWSQSSGGSGGGGGGSTGSDGTGNPNPYGRGGTQVAGGSAGTNGESGDKLYGGSGRVSANDPSPTFGGGGGGEWTTGGSGGGGGYYGGGGSGYAGQNLQSSGGGGSSYVGGDGVTIAASGRIPGGISDENYNSGHGYGGQSNGAGQDGYIVIVWGDGGSSNEGEGGSESGSWSTVLNQTLDVQGSGWTGYHHRITLDNSLFSASSTKVRLTFQSSSGGSLAMNPVYIGHRDMASDEWVFNGTATQVTFSSGSSGFSIGTSSEVVSDEINFTIDPTKDIIVSFYISSGGYPRIKSSVSGVSGQADGSGASGEVDDINSVGLTVDDNRLISLSKLEVYS